jgi:hypothetical protein
MENGDGEFFVEKGDCAWYVRRRVTEVRPQSSWQTEQDAKDEALRLNNLFREKQ